MSRRLTILGSTGSIGDSTLSVVAHARATHGPDAFPLEALTAQIECRQTGGAGARISSASCGNRQIPRSTELKKHWQEPISRWPPDTDAIRDAAARPSDVVMVAIIGAASLVPTLAAVKRGATIALANKECVVAAGDVFRDALAASRAIVIPVDSEHNAAFQLLDFAQAHAIERVTLTASGGPFREWTRERMEARDAGTGGRASELVDGRENFRRQRDIDEQGP